MHTKLIHSYTNYDDTVSAVAVQSTAGLRVVGSIPHKKRVVLSMNSNSTKKTTRVHGGGGAGGLVDVTCLSIYY